MTIERDNIPELNIELMEDKKGSLILLEQDCCGNVDRVCIHPVHLRYMAEKFGLIATSDPTAHKTIAMLTRRLNLLSDRIAHLSRSLESDPDKCHQAYARATAEIANEFCAELPDSPQASLI